MGSLLFFGVRKSPPDPAFMSLLSRIPGGHLAAAAVAALLVLAGFTVLWMGGVTSAAMLLVVGYVIAIPIALLAYASAPETKPTPANSSFWDSGEPPPYKVAALVGLAVFVLYLLTLAPTTAMWDTSEYIAAAKTLGIPHPPGNPVFVLVAHAFAALPFPVSYAERVNLLAATTPGVSGRVYNVGTGRATSLLELLSAICELTGKPYDPDFQPPRVGDVRESWADISRARDELGYAPQVDLMTGLKRTIEAMS